MRTTIFICVILLFSITAWSNDQVGEISKTEGKVLIYRGDSVRGSTVDQPEEKVTIGDSITTKREALAFLNFIDGNRVILKENSTLLVTGMGANAVSNGKVLFDVRKRGELKGFEVTSGTITMGVRGTRFAVENKNGKVAVHLKEGRLHIESESGPLKRHRPDDLEGFRDLQLELKTQTDVAKEKMRQQFEESKRHMLAGDLEYVDSIDLESGSSLVFEGNEVWQSALPDWAEQEFLLFDKFPTTEP